MKIYQLENSVTVSAPIEVVWEFFSNPNNLAVMTPPALGFRFAEPPPEEMFPGLVTKFSMSPFFGVRFRWENEIKDIIKGEQFVDIQRKGPFGHWKHTHYFREIGSGVELGDRLEYALPFGKFGETAKPIIDLQLKKMFGYRNAELDKLFI